MRYIELFEGVYVNKRPLVFYHGTNSDPFDTFEPSKAAKGEQHWNPLGNALYVTNDESFTHSFGRNT